jgi:predicted amidohydrolase
MASLAAVCQLTSGADVGRNLETCRRLVHEARRRGAALVALPENFAFIGQNEGDAVAHAEPLPPAGSPGPILSAMMETAQREGVWLLCGAMPERSEWPTKMYNTSVLLSPEGKIVARYRKIHLFDVGIPNGPTFQESRTVAPGAETVVAETALGTIGLSVCYDLRFPELYRALVARGARILTVPSAFTQHTGKDHWHPLLRARAIESQCYVLAPAQFGRPNEKRVCYGHALIVDPWGTVVAEASDHEGVVLGEIDIGFQEKVRRELPCLTHRRL